MTKSPTPHLTLWLICSRVCPPTRWRWSRPRKTSKVTYGELGARSRLSRRPGRGRHRARRPRRHRAAQRPADHRELPGRFDRRHGGAAQPDYKDEEFRFYLEDTNARVLLVPPDGAEAARRAAAGDAVPVLAVGNGCGGRRAAGGRGRAPRRRAAAASTISRWSCTPAAAPAAQARAAPPPQPGRLGAEHRAHLRARPERTSRCA